MNIDGADRQERRAARGFAACGRRARRHGGDSQAHRQAHSLHRQHERRRGPRGRQRGDGLGGRRPRCARSADGRADRSWRRRWAGRPSSRTPTCSDGCRRPRRRRRPRRCRRRSTSSRSMDFFNGEAIVLSHQQGHTDGDSLVFFRRSDVIVTGDVFTPGRYPSIDLARGGSVQGLVRALDGDPGARSAGGVCRGRHQDDSRPRPRGRGDRRRRVPRHGRHRPRSRAGSRREEDDARADQGGEAVARLRRRVRCVAG